MSKRVLAVLALAVLPSLLSACDRATSPNVAYTSPGWYIERPSITLAAGPQIFAGPFTYDQCEAKRVNEFDPATAERLLCIHEYTKPGPFGPY